MSKIVRPKSYSRSSRLGFALVTFCWLIGLVVLLLDLSSFNICSDNMDLLCRQYPGTNLTDLVIWIGFGIVSVVAFLTVKDLTTNRKKT